MAEKCCRFPHNPECMSGFTRETCEAQGGTWVDKECFFTALVTDQVATVLPVNPVIELTLPILFSSMEEFRQLMTQSPVGRRMLDLYRRSGREARDAARSDPELSREITRLILVATRLSQDVLVEYHSPDAVADWRRGKAFTQELFEEAIAVTNRMKRATRNSQVIEDLDEFQETLEHYVGLTPPQILVAMMAPASPEGDETPFAN